MYTKEQYLDIKKTIKNMVIEQKENKRNRKTVYIQGERTTDAGTATWKHSSLRFSLHKYYIAYAIVRGKSTEWIVQHVDKNYTTENEIFQTIIKKHEKVICVSQK